MAKAKSSFSEVQIARRIILQLTNEPKKVLAAAS